MMNYKFGSELKMESGFEIHPKAEMGEPEPAPISAEGDEIMLILEDAFATTFSTSFTMAILTYLSFF